MNNAKNKKNMVFLVAGIIFVLIGLLAMQSNKPLAIASIVIGIILILLYFLTSKGAETGTVTKAAPQQSTNNETFSQPAASTPTPHEQPSTHEEPLRSKQSLEVPQEIVAEPEPVAMETAETTEEEPTQESLHSMQPLDILQTTVAKPEPVADENTAKETVQEQASDDVEPMDIPQEAIVETTDEEPTQESLRSMQPLDILQEVISEPATVEDTPVRSMPASEPEVILHKIKLIDSEVIQRIAKRFVAFDFETTGLNRTDDRVVEIGAVLFQECKPTDRFNSLINPDFDFSTKIIRLNEENYASQPKEEEVFPGFVSFLGDVLDNQTILVAHNADFDASFLAAMLKRHGKSAEITYIDTLRLSRAFIPGLANYKQPTIARHLGMETDSAQTADIDAEICGKVFLHMLPLIQSHAKEQENLAKNKQPTIAQKGVCAYLAKLLAENGRDVSKLVFEKTENGIILAKHPLPFVSFRISRTKPLSLYFNKDFFIKAEGVAISTDGDSVRARVTSLEGIDLLKESLLKGYDSVTTELEAFYGDSAKVAKSQESSFSINDSETASLIAGYNDYRRDKSEKKPRRKKKQ